MSASPAQVSNSEPKVPETHVHNHTHHSHTHGAIYGCMHVIERLVYGTISLLVALFFLASQFPGTTLQLRSDCVVFRVGDGSVVNIDTCSSVLENAEGVIRSER